jgi:hypothetical protein
MAGSTSNYGLKKLGAGEHLSDDGYKYTSADRDQIDTLLKLGAETHHHTGAAPSSYSATAPTLTLSTTGGVLPAGTRIWYAYTYVDANGSETGLSTSDYVDTAAPVSNPAAPTLTSTATTGTLIPGNYYYVLSAYTGSSASETQATNPNYITVPAGTNTNKITLTLPTPPAGATGFNIYRQKPGSSGYFWLTTAVGSSYVDNGSVTEDCNRVLPTRNSTNSTNKVTVELPGAVPADTTWKIYRTTNDGIWTNSVLKWVIEETFDGSGIITPEYIDVGTATSLGNPPTTSQLIGTPAKVLLTGAAEVQGSMPMGLTAFPFAETWGFFGTLEIIVPGTSVWVCPFPAATIVFVKCALGRGYAPASGSVIVDVNKGSGATPTYTTIFTTQSNRPSIGTGRQIGAKAYPDVKTLVEGDSLSVDIDAIGGGATRTDKDLTVTVYMIAHGFPAATSFVAGTTTGTGA